MCARASARSDDLQVRQHSAEGLRRCTVVLDQQVPAGTDHDEAFERAVVAAQPGDPRDDIALLAICPTGVDAPATG